MLYTHFRSSLGMGSGIRLLFIFHILVQLVGLLIAQPEFIENYCNYDYQSNYTTNSTFQTNLDAIPSYLSSNSTFYNFSIGVSPDTVNVIALCRGDVEPTACRSCLSDANTKLRELCLHEKESIGWYDNCLLRYSDRSIFHTNQTLPNAYTYNPELATNGTQFNQAVKTLLETLRPRAAGGDSLLKYATGNAAGPGTPIFALVQCTPDLSGPQCNSCLEWAFTVLPSCCDGKIGGRVVAPSCNFRYEIGQFYATASNSTPSPTDATPSSDAPPPPSSLAGKKDNTKTVVIVVVPTVISVILVIVSICIFIKKRKHRTPKQEQSEIEAVDDISIVESLRYNFETIRIATDDFSDTNKLGQGGFGGVYKGMFPNGQNIAVKRLSMNSGQGEIEFKNEVLLVAKLQHRNLVRLLGFCFEGTERLLVYEFVPNASLDHFVFDPVKRANLDWDSRYKIIGGIARGLLYLHEDSRLRIIHRDLKASNVLLDEEMNPKISDFGMARLFALDETQGSTSRIVGTFGYMAPEYIRHGQFSVKSDVFSFGVLVLEIVSGQKSNCFQDGDNIENVSTYAWRNWRQGKASKVIDPTLMVGSSSIRDIERCIHIGLLCVQENATDRPTMASVGLMLSSNSLTLAIPSEPAFFMHSSTITPEMPLGDYSSGTNESIQSKSKSVQLSVNDLSITELDPR